MNDLRSSSRELYNAQNLERELLDALFDWYVTETVLNMANPSDYFTLSDGRKVETRKYLEGCEDSISTTVGALILIRHEDVVKEALSRYEPSMSSEK